jgi:FlgD Ig-like domain
MKSRLLFALCLLLVIPAVVKAQWTDTGTAVSALQNDQRVLSMCSDGAGGAFIVWEDYRTDPGSDLYAQRISSTGVPQWAANGIVVCNVTPGSQYQPRMISDNAGGCIIAWQDSRGGGATSHVYAQRLNALGSSLWTFNGVLVTNVTGDQIVPTLCSDGGNGAIITWYDSRNLATTGWDIYAQRISTGGIAQWTANGVPICTAAADQSLPQIAIDGTNGAIIVWRDLRAGSGTYDLWAQRVFGNGAIAWFANGTAVCQASNNQDAPVIVSDGANGALVAWQDFRNGTDWDIYAQRLNLNGAWLWTTNGAAICTMPNYQFGLSLISDGQQGAYLAWNDARNVSTNGNDVYMQRVAAAGNPLWAPQGLAVANGPTNEQIPTLTSDGANGVMVVFGAGSGLTDAGLWAQRLDNNGTSYWATNGVRVSNIISGYPNEPKAIADASGNVIVGWYAYPGGYGTESNVYATRIDGRFGYWGKPEPTLFAVKDVPNDQGGKVRVEWYASSRDQLNQGVISKYTIWRGIDQAMYANEVAAGVPDVKSTDPPSSFSGKVVRHEKLQALDYFWELIGTENAAYRFAYAFTAATSFDSTAANAATHRFQVLAHAGSDLINWPSNVLTGRSVDNLAPPAPLFLTAQRIGNYVYLKWNGVHVPDLDKYTVYRKTSTGVTPIPANFLADDPDTLLTDSTAPTSAVYYIVTATDIHQNQGLKSNEASVAAATGVGGNLPPVTALTVLQNHPNPFTGETQLQVGLPTKGDVRVEVYDVAGRRVRTAVMPSQARGWNTLRLDARDDRGALLPSGVYFYRVHAGAETVTRKMVIAR